MNRGWRPRTLRSRLALWTAVGGTVLLTVYILGLYLFGNSSLLNDGSSGSLRLLLIGKRGEKRRIS